MNCIACEGKRGWFCDCTLPESCTHMNGLVYCKRCNGTGKEPEPPAIILDARMECRNCKWVELAPTRKGMMQNLKCGIPEGFMMDAQVPHEDWACTDFELREE